MKPADPERASFVGAALTCECGANDNLAIMAALVIAQPGDVIIASCDGFAATAGVGDNLAMMAKNKGIVAIVTDGMARDRDGIVAAGLPVFARGITPNSACAAGPAGWDLRSFAAALRWSRATSCWAIATASW